MSDTQTVERTQRRDLLKESGRIVPREVLEACEKIGMIPGFGCWENCAITILAYAAGYFDHQHEAKNPGSALSPDIEGYMESRGVKHGFWDFSVVASDYTSGFTRGYDGMEMSDPPAPDDHPLVLGAYGWERQGWMDGRRVRRFVLSRYPEAS